MPTVGRTLAAERVRQGYDPEDVVRAIKIGSRSVKAIEADDYDQLPGRVFARNFVRQYAQFLKLDAPSVVEQFDREQTDAAPAFAQSSSSSSPGSGFPLSNLFENNALSAFFAFVSTIVVCALLFIGYQYWRTRSARNPPASPAAASKARAKPAAVPAVATPGAKLDASQPAIPGSKVQVTVAAVDPCWVRVTADGKTLFAGTLAAGESKEINAASVAVIRAGNAGALSLKLNGQAIPEIGPKGQVRVVTLTASGAQVRTPTDPVSDFR